LSTAVGADLHGSSSEIALVGSWLGPNLVLLLSLVVSLRSTLGNFVEPLLFRLPLDLLLTKLHVDLGRGCGCDCAGTADIPVAIGLVAMYVRSNSGYARKTLILELLRFPKEFRGLRRGSQRRVKE
jgi:hypothetical protein